MPASYQASLLSWIRRKLAGRGMGERIGHEDIAQEAWLRAAPAIAAGKIENERAYMFRIAGNLIADEAKARSRQDAVIIESDTIEHVPTSEPSIEDHLIAKERLALLTDIAEQLPPRCREVFRLRKSEGLTTSEIALRLGISRNMAEKHMRHALLFCSSRLEELEV